MLLQIKDIEISYGTMPIVNGVSINVNNNEIVSLIGPNGAGKSTVLKAIMNLGDTFIPSGEIFFNGKNIKNLQPHQIIKKGISYIPQGNSVFHSMTIEENLKVALNIAGNGKYNFETVYDRFPVLKEKKLKRTSELSGGEKQMLGLARALVTRPKLLLLDEPSIGLSPKLSAEVFSRIKSFKKEGTSIILVEQRVKEAIEASDRVYILRAGKIYFEGTKEDVLRSEHLKKAYLGG